jgi:hypothetical protein
MASHPPVRLTVPAEPSSVRLARLVAGGVAADAGLSVEDTEDLRIAVSEMVALLIDGSGTGPAPAEVTYRRAPGMVEVSGELRCRTPVPAGPSPTEDLALEILRVVVDHHDFEVDGDLRRFHLVKRARIPA